MSFENLRRKWLCVLSEVGVDPHYQKLFESDLIRYQGIIDAQKYKHLNIDVLKIN